MPENVARTEGLTWENVLGEDELLRTLGVTKSALAKMRSSGMPCLYLTARCRLYVDCEVLAWAAGHSKPRVGKNVQN